MQTILNICLNGPYSDGFTYQDNLLPKYHKVMGYNVTVFAPAYQWGKSGAIEHVGESDYINNDGVRVLRIENDQRKPPTYRFKTFRKLYSMIETVSPDIIFLHGLQMRDSATVVKYIREHSEVKLYVDNHADYSNSASSWVSRHVLHKIIWKHYAKILEPVTSIFWGVLPARVNFLIENYGIPRDKCHLLVMGADDEEVNRANAPMNRDAVRSQFGFDDDDFVIVTGGKIDSAKRQTLALMDAVAKLDDCVHLLIFGPVASELREEFESKFVKGKMSYVPWASSSESYDFFAAADLICFPGRHSVYWEQAAAMGKPLVVKDWPGTHHINCGGNVIFVAESNACDIGLMLDSLLKDDSALRSMEKRAREGSKRFMYSNIARQSINEQQYDSSENGEWV